jgi:hypothetical protein
VDAELEEVSLWVRQEGFCQQVPDLQTIDIDIAKG